MNFSRKPPERKSLKISFLPTTREKTLSLTRHEAEKRRSQATRGLHTRQVGHRPRADHGECGPGQENGDPAPCWWERRTVRPLHLSKLNRAATCPDTSATRGRIKGTSQVHVKTRTRPFSGVLFSTVKSGNDRDAYQWMMGKQTLRRPHGEGHCQPRGRDSAARHDTDGSL